MTMILKKSRATGVVFGVLTVLSWAGYNVAAKEGVNAGLSPITLSFLRYATPGLVALPLWFWLRRRSGTNGNSFARLIILAILGGPIFGSVAIAGYQYAPLSYGLLFAPVAVFVVGTLWSVLLLKERVSGSRVAGAGVMFVGLAIVAGPGAGEIGPDWMLGVVLFVAAGALWGTYTAFLRHWRISPIEGAAAIATVSSLFALLAFSQHAVQQLAHIDRPVFITQSVMQGLVGGVISVVALAISVQSLSVQTAAMLPTFTPAVAILVAWSLLNKQPAAFELLGAAVVFIGFALTMRKRLIFVLPWSLVAARPHCRHRETSKVL